MKKDEIKKYIYLMYDKASDLNHIEDLNLRKEKAAFQSGLDMNDPEIRNIMNLKNKKVTDEIITYVNRNNSNAYSKLVADQQLFLRLQEKLMVESDGEDLIQLMKISEQMEALVDRIYLGYKNVYRDVELIEIGEKQVKMISLEQRLSKKNTA